MRTRPSGGAVVAGDCNGNGIPEDNVRAHMWWSLGNANGLKAGARLMDVVEQYMTPDQIAKAQELATEMWEKIND